MAIFARLRFVPQLKREASPAKVVKGRRRLIELASIVAARAIPSGEGAELRFKCRKCASVRVGVTSFTSLSSPAEDATRLSMRCEHAWLFDRRHQGVMASLATEVYMTLLELKARVCVRINIKVVRREAITIMASQAGPLLIRGVIKLLLVHVLVATRTLIRRAAWVCLGETLPRRPNVAATALQSIMRSIQIKATRCVPTRLEYRVRT